MKAIISNKELKLEMIRQDLTLKTLAEKAGMPLSTLANISAGTEPLLGNAVLIADALDVPLDSIIEKVEE